MTVLSPLKPRRAVDFLWQDRRRPFFGSPWDDEVNGVSVTYDFRCGCGFQSSDAVKAVQHANDAHHAVTMAGIIAPEEDDLSRAQTELGRACEPK